VDGEGLWDAKDVAAFLKVSRSWVYLHAEGGKLPSVRIGGLRRFVPAQIRVWALGGAGGDVVPLAARRGR
jgi:excisionase family DNA binding protein